MNGYTYIVFVSVFTVTLLKRRTSIPNDEISVNMADMKNNWTAEKACTRQGCFGLSYPVLNRIYSGIFLTEKEMKRKSCAKEHDNDLCCPTRTHYKHQTHMLNTQGHMKALLHLPGNPPRYQYIPYAECAGGGGCQGECRMEYTAVHLLVFAMNSPWPFEFDMFDVPMYCSCKSS